MELTGRGAAYIRISTTDQDVKRQYETIHATLERQGVPINSIQYFEDQGYARDDINRPDFQRLLQQVELGELDWVLVDRQDRFGTKDAEDFVHFRRILNQNHCRLLTCDGQDLTNKDIGTLILGILNADKSRSEQIEKSNRVLKGQVVKARQGLYLGGLPPFALDVVCFRSLDDFTEEWRVVYDGKKRRRKVLPDGRSVRYDGEGNMPKQEGNQVLRLWPSTEQNKLDAVRNVFSTYATEAISFTKLARLLNESGFRAGGGTMFQSENILDLLNNPAYIGKPAWNKRHVGKFHRWKDGQAIQVDDDGRQCLENPREDWIVLETNLYPPIVDSDIWTGVQTKLDLRQVKPRTPRNEKFILSGLLVCGNCEVPMVAGTRKKRNGSTGLEYYCSTYQNWVAAGRVGQCDCLRHTVEQSLVFGFVEQYLVDIQEELKAVRESAVSGVLSPLKQHRHRHSELWGEMLSSVLEMHQYVQSRLKNGAAIPPEITVEVGDLGAIKPLYLVLRNEEFAHLDAEYKRLDDEHTELTSRFAAMPKDGWDRCRDKVLGQIGKLEQRLNDVEDRRVNRAERYEASERMLLDLERAIDHARQSLVADAKRQANRRQIEALRGAIQSIEIWFEPLGPDDPVPTGRVRKGGSKPVKIRITPTVGEPFERGFDNIRDNRASSRDTD